MEIKGYLKKAQKDKWAIGQFNFSTLDQLRGILAAARKSKSLVILGTSEGESRYLGLEEILALVEISKMKYKVPAFLNLDHAKNLKLIKKAVDFGYSAVHFDGSDLSFKENIKRTREVVKYAHKKRVLVEGELGCIRGESKLNKGKALIKKEDLTPLELVSKFVKETKVDSLAIAIGNIHGVYKGKPRLDFKLLKEISKKTNAFLVLHGGSGIPNAYVKKAIKLGIVKVNINTELRIAWKRALDKTGDEVKPYKVLPQVEDAVQKKVIEKIKLFDTKGKI